MFDIALRMAVFRVIALLIVLGMLAATVALSSQRLEQRPSAAGTAAEPVYVPRAELLRPLSLGYHNVLADILWFRTISYFGQHYQADRTYPWLAHMCDIVTDLDPKADHVYRFAGVVLPWEANQVDAGIRLLEKGARAFPDSWLIHYWLGFNYYYFKDDYRAAAEYMARAAQLPGAHANAARFAALLYAKQYSPETTLQLLREVESEVDNEEMRAVIRQQIKEAQMSLDQERLRAPIEEFRARAGRLPASLDELARAHLIAYVPPDPFGGQYAIDQASGELTSSTGQRPSRLHESSMRNRVLEGESPRDL